MELQATAARPDRGAPGHSGPDAARVPRRADIQGLRGVAVILVVCFHAGLRVPGGFIGVDVFFVISGFVIASLLLAEATRTDRLSFSTFYSRRVRRILPALAVAITLVSFGAVFILSPLGPQQQTARTGAAAAVMGANIQLYRSPVGYFTDATSIHNALLNTWSLSVEEQFYLAFPAILLGAWTLGRRSRRDDGRRRAAAIALALVAGASFALNLALTQGCTFWGWIASPQQWAFYGAPSRAWEFCAGALMAIAVPRVSRLPSTVAMAAGMAGAVLVGAAAFAFGATTVFPGTAALVPVAGSVLLLAAGTAAPAEGLSHWFSGRVLVWVGDRSYGWYLWHWPAIVFAAAIWPGRLWIQVAAALGSLVVAHLSFVLLEARLRSRHELAGRRVLPLAAVCVVVPLVGCLAIAPAASALESSATKQLMASQQLHADFVRGCDSSRPFDTRPERCTWSVAHPKGTVALVGDSNAGQLTEGAAIGANRAGYDLEVATLSSCPFADLEVIRYGQAQTACADFVQRSLPQIVRRHPSLVIVALGSAAYVPVSSVRLRDLHRGAVASDPDSKARLWTTGIRSVLDQLSRAGIRTVFVHTMPEFNWDPVDCGIQAHLSPQSCGMRISRRVAEADRRLDYEAERLAVAGIPNATAVDLSNDICTASACSTYRNGLWWYRDGGHLSVAASRLLAPQLETIIRTDAGP